MIKYIILIVSILINSISNAQVIIDESFSDWETAGVSVTDSQNDGVNGLDFRDMKIKDDTKYLYLFFNTTKEINLQSDNNVSLFLDIDNDENTGYKINGIGADISYFFGARYGFFYRNGSTIQIYHNNIELISLPTVTSDSFELAIKREFKAGQYLVKMNNNIRMFLVEDTPSGDKIPDEQGGTEYSFSNNLFNPPAFNIEKKNPSHLRIMSFNVERDHFFDYEPPYQRMIKAGKPDILCFQEVYNHSASNMKNRIQFYFGGTWYSSKIGSDLIVVSKYPITKSTDVDGNGAFLINKEGTNILIINNHLYCCDKDASRQKEVDEIMNFIRKSKNGTGAIPMAKNTPIIILGDMNFVGSNRQRKTLLEGDISNESNYGPDFLPDWDNTFLEDATPLTTGFPAAFTWNSDNSSYPKGRLDYVIYTGSVLKKENAFALFTRELDRDILDKYQLNAEDTDNASDHFPVFVDFSFKNSISTNELNSKDDVILKCFPNPANDYVNIEINSKFNGLAKITVFDVTGRKLYDKSIDLKYGINNKRLDISNFDMGIYYINVRGKKFSGKTTISILKN